MSVMPYERAAEILDPARGERFTDMEPVNKALYMGRDALLLRIPRSPYPGWRQKYSGLPQLRERRIPAQSG